MVAARGRALCRWLHAGQGQVIPARRIRPSPAAPRGVRCSSGAGLATAAGRRRRCRRPRKQQLSREGPSIRGSRIPRTAQLGPIISKPFSSARSIERASARYSQSTGFEKERMRHLRIFQVAAQQERARRSAALKPLAEQQQQPSHGGQGRRAGGGAEQRPPDARGGAGRLADGEARHPHPHPLRAPHRIPPPRLRR